MAHVIPKDTQYHTNFNQELQRATIFDFPTKISAFAIMRKKGFSESTVTTGSLDNLYKPWPSNPTIDNILDETTYPLNVYFAPRKDNYGKYVYETYTYNARGYRSHYTYQIEIGMTSITAITIWNKVENHSMDGHVGNEQKVFIQRHKAAFHLAAGIYQHPPGNGQRAIQPGGHQHPAVSLHGNAGIVAGGFQIRPLLHPEGGAVRVAGGQHKAGK